MVVLPPVAIVMIAKNCCRYALRGTMGYFGATEPPAQVSSAH
jgi:hypothetical protein